MKILHKRYVLPLVLALAVTPVLSACSVQQIVSNATGGKVDLGGASVPKDFPSDVPLVKGKVIYGAAIADSKSKVWNVTIQVDGLASVDGIVAQLTDKGFTQETDATVKSNDGGTVAFSNDTYKILVVIAKGDKDTWVANYTVTNAKNSN